MVEYPIEQLRVSLIKQMGGPQGCPMGLLHLVEDPHELVGIRRCSRSFSRFRAESS